MSDEPTSAAASRSRTQGTDGYLRYPHLHEELLCFVAEDDLWLAPLPAQGRNPGRAWRLTVDRTRIGPPRFSPDGRQIAFTSWRTLDPEIHLAPVDGGEIRQLSHWGSYDTRVCGWTPAEDARGSRVLALGAHEQPFSHYTWAYTVPVEGGPGERLPWGPVADIAVAGAGPERRTLLLTGKAPHEPASWKRYRGGAMGRLWYHGRRLLPALNGHVDSPMLVGDRIAFLSDHEGVGNLYSCRPDGTELWRHTDHEAFYARHASTDGRRVVYQCGGDLWLVEELGPGSVPRRLNVRLGGPRTGRRPYQVRTAAHVDDLSVDATGRASAVCVRGGLYWLTHRDGPARALAATPGVRVREPEMLGDTGRIAYVTDAAGEDAIEIAHLPRASGGKDPLRLPLPPGTLGRVLELVSSPDGQTLAIATHDGRLLTVPVPEAPTTPPEPAPGPDPGAPATAPEAGAGASPDTPAPQAAAAADAGPQGRAVAEAETGRSPESGAPQAQESAAETGHSPGGAPEPEAEARVREVVRSDNGPVRGVAFSPDSRWVAWAQPGVGRSLSRVRIADLGAREGGIVDVTDGRFADEEPVFTRDGRYLAFLSWRGFDPVYDVHTGDLSFPVGCRPYLVPLSSATRSPFAITPEGRPAAGGLDPADAPGGEEGTVLVEAEGLNSRVTPFPVAASKYSSLYPVSGGGLVWLRWPISGALGETFVNPDDTSGKPTLEHFDLAKAKRSELTDDVDWFAPSGDGTRLVVCEDEELRTIPATEGGDGDASVHVDLRRIVHTAVPAAEWRQAFEEAGRLIRDYFWEPDMGGVDWAGVLDQYRPLLERVASPDEFADLLRETVGELGTSHAYVSPARRNEGPPHYQRAQGLLGANFARTKEGSWQVTRILPGESSDSKARSPLAGTGVKEGAVLTHVGGRPVDPVAGPWPLLAGTGGTSVELTFAEEGGGRRRVAVVPLIFDRPLRYQDWVARRREVVRELSEGRCGYVHIPDLSGSGWAQFNRDLRMEIAREALIVDVRGNAGGNISELVIEKLSRPILGWDLTRNTQAVSYTSDAPRGPVVAVADEATSSDGDMITAAFRLLGLGPVVGSRTWGGVVGITGHHRLGDGTSITVPMNAAWFDSYGWGVENHGVVPDLEVVRSPVDWAEGRTVVLERAVRVAVDLLEKHPASAPPGYRDLPSRARPPLPPRTAGYAPEATYGEPEEPEGA
ncbi:PDZ domain-containing protein [Streptomyces sp. DSM 44917]|uniref:PDZ domain-containing protein n=1 Tax=Streptomyces boetiae TaxID=3075541 RepID=A0ABU2LC56_9ACTN|nr:S41 family peptidase [Streptomyces sp. DSM 44917]MDT0309090.1 PDZ domain-containing protein [Streptomyces sp. DSM 44917]